MMSEFNAHGISPEGEKHRHGAYVNGRVVIETVWGNDTHEGTKKHPVRVGGTHGFGIATKDYYKPYDWSQIKTIRIERAAED